MKIIHFFKKIIRTYLINKIMSNKETNSKGFNLDIIFFAYNHLDLSIFSTKT